MLSFYFVTIVMATIHPMIRVNLERFINERRPTDVPEQNLFHRLHQLMTLAEVYETDEENQLWFIVDNSFNQQLSNKTRRTL
jgi:hypothetical protein